jgi:hypothetical protein
MPEHLLDTLGVREKVLDALADTVKECAKETAKEIGKEYGKELAARTAAKAVSPLAGELAQAVGGELAKAVAGAFVGPLIGILFKVVDDTKARITKVLSEPEITAVREARRFLDLPSDSPADAVLIEEKFASVSDAFDRAYTFAQGERDATARMLWIRMMQGLIARRRGGSSVARLYFEECLALLTQDYPDLAARRRESEKETKRGEEALDREDKKRLPERDQTLAMARHPQAVIAFAAHDAGWPTRHQRNIERLRTQLEEERQKLNEIQNMENFVAIVRQFAANAVQ